MPKRSEMKDSFKINREDDGKRFDNLLIKICKNIPKSLIYRLVRKGQIRLNGKKVKVSDRVQETDLVELPGDLIGRKTLGEAPLWLKKLVSDSFVYEDEKVIVLDKPSGVPSHGGTKLEFGVIETVRQIKDNCPRIDLVHRLDRATSGCLIMTKNPLLLRNMHKFWNSDKVSKTYTALVSGVVTPELSEVKSNLKIDRRDKIRKNEPSSSANAKYSETEIIDKIPISKKFTLLKLSLKTGRMHQIRSQFSHIGHPIIGDQIYGNREFNTLCKLHGLARMFLHCSSISIEMNEYKLSVNCNLPKELTMFLDRVSRNQTND